MVIPMGTKIDKCSIYTDRFRRQLVSFSLEQFKSFTERNSRMHVGLGLIKQRSYVVWLHNPDPHKDLYSSNYIYIPSLVIYTHLYYYYYSRESC